MTTQTQTITGLATLPERRQPETFVQLITPETAADMLQTMRYPHQRVLRKAKVDAYAADMARGKFRPLTQIFIGIYQGRHYLLDGQHRLQAVVASGVSIPFDVAEMDVISEEELADLYSQTDKGLRRTAGDVYGAYDLGEEFGLGKTMLDAFGAGIKFMLNSCNRNPVATPHDAIVPHMRLYGPYIQTYQQLLTEAKISLGVLAQYKRSSTIAAALLSFRYTAPKAEKTGRQSVRDFWLGVMTDDGLRLGDPRKAANQHLLLSRVTSNGSAAQRNIVSQAYSVRYLASCLNAHLKGESLKYAKVPDETAPLNMYGVPADSAQWW